MSDLYIPFFFMKHLCSNARKNHSPSPNVKLLTKIAKHASLGPEYSIKNEPIIFLAQCFENSNPNTDLRIPTFYCKAQIRVGAIQLPTHIYTCVFWLLIFSVHIVCIPTHHIFPSQLIGQIKSMTSSCLETLSVSRARICKRLRSPEIDSSRNRFCQPMYPGGPIRQIGLSYRPAKLGIDSCAP